MARGVAILLQRNLPITIETFRTDADGCYIIMDVILNDFKFIIINVYAPNEDNPNFYIQLFEAIES